MTSYATQPSLQEKAQRSRLGPLLRSAHSLLKYVGWRRQCQPPAPPHVKRSMLVEYVNRYQPDAFVETGTYRGDTVAKVRGRVASVVSIELDEQLATLARRRFARCQNVTIVQGDSAEMLRTVVPGLPGRAVFWLDGHYSGGVTAGAGACPLTSELLTILADARDHIILVDDVRLFGTSGYPTVDEIHAALNGSGRLFDVKNKLDTLRIVPSSLSRDNNRMN